MFMIKIIMLLVLIGGLVGGLALAASRGYTIPIAVCLALIVGGIVLILAPTAFSFLLQLAGRVPKITEDEKIAGWIIGSVMILIGVTASLFSRKSISGPPK